MAPSPSPSKSWLRLILHRRPSFNLCPESLLSNLTTPLPNPFLSKFAPGVFPTDLQPKSARPLQICIPNLPPQICPSSDPAATTKGSWPPNFFSTGIPTTVLTVRPILGLLRSLLSKIKETAPSPIPLTHSWNWTPGPTRIRGPRPSQI